MESLRRWLCRVAACISVAGWWSSFAASVEMTLHPDKPNEISFTPVEAKVVRVVIHRAAGAQPCIDEMEVYAPEGKENLALASRGAIARASSLLPGYPIHQIEHLNDGRYGNSRSWIAAQASGEWAEIELPQPTRVAKVVISRDREGRYRDRLPVEFEVRTSLDGKTWTKVAEVKAVGVARSPQPAAPPPPPSPKHQPPALWAAVGFPVSAEEPAVLQYAFLLEANSFWLVNRRDPIPQVLEQMEQMLERFAFKGLDISAERAQLAELQNRHQQLSAKGDLSISFEQQFADEKNIAAARQQLLYDARLAKRRLMLRDPDLQPLQSVLFVHRYPYTPSHNYSDIYDSKFRGGGGVCILRMKWQNGRLAPATATVQTLFDAGGGIARDAVLDYDARTIYFAYRPAGRSGESYWNLMRMNVDGSDLKQLTHGPFHDYYPCVLPDGDVAFVSTRCRARYLCWVPQSMVLFRMKPDGSDIRPISHANLSEWGPSVMRDGRILWTRSEYLDKGADYGHTLWAIRPDGTHPELIYGNNTVNCLMNGREVPGSHEICATLISHFGDFNGPIALIDVSKGRFNPQAARVITPDTRAMSNEGRFRDPVPITRDYILVSHAPVPHGNLRHLPFQHFGIYVIDRYGNRELLYLNVEETTKLSAMCPTPLRPTPRPPILAPTTMSATPGKSGEEEQDAETGRLIVLDVYEGLGPAVPRGMVKYLRVCEELRSPLERLSDGRLRETYPDFQQYYASPTDRISGPHGWPSYVAKGVLGIVPVEADGSAYFEVPSGKVIYFQALDEELNEIQRMRSVMQVHAGEVRTCVGCHEDRLSAPPPRGPVVRLALKRPEPARLQPPPWGAGPFAYEKVVQPALDAHCVRCHGADDKRGIDLTGTHDVNKAPASFRTLIKGGWVHYFNYGWHEKHSKADPLTFGTVRSRLWKALESKDHAEVKLSRDEMHAIKCWTDLNCPLWPDYSHRSQRLVKAETPRESGGAAAR